jgi:hypothetical protein
MFGWLATRSSSPCRHAMPVLVSRRARRVTPRSWVGALPALGSVLYVRQASCAFMQDNQPTRVLAAQRCLAPLLDTRWLVAASVVTDDGPREWLECLDRFGRARARLHLLPDTDYLAWDALVATCSPDCLSLGGLADAPLLRPDHATVMQFQVRELAGLLLLEPGRTCSLSPLSDRVAARIARAESAVLLK